MPRAKIRLKGGEAVDVAMAASALSEKLISHHGLRLALVIARLVHEKTFASYKRIEEKYGKVT